MACVQEFREDERASDWALVRNVLALDAVRTALVAAGLLHLGQVGLVGVLVAEGATRPRRVERPKTVLVEVSHLVHTGYSGVVQYIAALIPKVFEEQPALGVAAVVLPWVPFVGAHAGALCAARAAVLARGDEGQVCEHATDRAVLGGRAAQQRGQGDEGCEHHG